MQFVAGVLVLAGFAFAGGANAEPYMAVREGYKCSQCHTNKSGGGKRTDYAQVYMQTRMAASRSFFDYYYRPPLDGASEPPAPLVGRDYPHGRLSESFSMGADLRTTFNYDYPSGATQRSSFNRDSSCETCHKSTNGGGKLAEVYFQFEAVPGKASLYVSENLVPTVASREMFALLEGMPLDTYVKVGTFRLPTTLIPTFDDPFLHGGQTLGARASSFDGVVGLEPVRANGVEVGLEPGPLSVSLSVTDPADPTKVTLDKRLALNAYAIGKRGMAGLKYSIDPIDEGVTRRVSGVYGGLHLGRLTGLIELDNVEADSTSGGSSTKSQAGMAELDFLLFKGHNLKYLYEFLDPDTGTSNDIRDRTSLIYEPFLTPYLQVRAGYRAKIGPPTEAAANGKKYFLELHFIY